MADEGGTKLVKKDGRQEARELLKQRKFSDAMIVLLVAMIIIPTIVRLEPMLDVLIPKLDKLLKR